MRYNRYDANSRIGNDFMTLALLGFVAMVIIMISFIAEPLQKKQLADPTGNLLVELDWPYEKPADVDLWVRGPDGVSVGYSNKGGPLFNLLRDDLGNFADLTKRNHEISVARGLPDGEYIVNVMLFNLKLAKFPVPVEVTVSTNKPINETGEYSSTEQLFHVTGELTKPQQEITMARFKIKNGYWDPDSFSTLFKGIASIPRGGDNEGFEGWHR